MSTESNQTASSASLSHGLFACGKPCTLDEWLTSPERVLKHLSTPATTEEVNRRRWGSAVSVSVDREELRACRRARLVTYDKKSRMWSLANR